MNTPHRKRKIGIYSGTFDPLHAGHIAFAQEAQQRLNMDEVIFLPERTPRNKPAVTEYKNRLESIRQEIQKHNGLSVYDIEVSPHTVMGLMQAMKPIFDASDIVLMVGSDTAMNLASWNDIEKLLAISSVFVGLRGDHTQEQVMRTMDGLQVKTGVLFKTDVARTEYSWLSSTSMREQLVQNNLSS